MFILNTLFWIPFFIMSKTLANSFGSSVASSNLGKLISLPKSAIKILSNLSIMILPGAPIKSGGPPISSICIGLNPVSNCKTLTLATSSSPNSAT